MHPTFHALCAAILVPECNFHMGYSTCLALILLDAVYMHMLYERQDL